MLSLNELPGHLRAKTEVILVSLDRDNFEGLSKIVQQCFTTMTSAELKTIGYYIAELGFVPVGKAIGNKDLQFFKL